MAWHQKYQVGNYDLGGVPWTAVFSFDGYSGPLTTLKGGGSPIRFEFLNGSDDIFDPWHPSQVKVSISVADVNFTLGKELYSVAPMHCYVEIFEGDEASSAGDPYWKGYVDPKGFSEPYDVLPYDIEVTCVDGLTVLEKILFYDTIDDLFLDSGDYYNNRTLETHIVLAILGKIGFTEFKEFIDLYEEKMNDTVDDSPMDQLKIDVDVFQDMYCDEVLKHILVKYNAWIMQIDGIFHIFRPVSLKNATVYGRWFTGDSTSTSISYTPEQFVSRRDTHLTNLKQVPGGRKITIDPAHIIKGTQDFGDKESWLDNFQFRADSFTDGPPLTSFNVKNWTRANSCNIFPASSEIGEDSNGVTIGDDSAYSGSLDSAKHIYQRFGNYAKATDNVINVSITYKLNNTSGGADSGVLVIVAILDVAKNVYLNEDDGTYAKWVYTPVSLMAGTINVPDGGTDWITYSRLVNGLVTDGPFEVRLYGLGDANAGTSIIYKDVIFKSTSDKVTVKKIKGARIYNFFRFVSFYILPRINPTETKYVDSKERVQQVYETQNNIYGDVKDYPFILGDVSNDEGLECDSDLDNVLEQFAGALSLDTNAFSLVDTAHDFVTNHQVSFSGVTLSHIGNVIFFTANAPGTDFSAAAAISNINGTLNGTAEIVTANTPGSPQITRLVISGGSGSLTLTVEGDSQIMAYYGSSIEDTIDNFVALYGSGGTDVFAPRTIAQGAPGVLEITGELTGATFTFSWTESGLTAVESGSDAPVAGVARVDKIILTGRSGQASISCDGDSATADVILVNTTTYTTKWHRGNLESSGDGENIPLIKLIVQEIAEQYSRPKQLIQMPIQDTGTGLSAVDRKGCFVDEFNADESDADPCVFVATRGDFDQHNRRWQLDLLELI